MLDESEFYAQSATKDGLQYNCKSCQKKRFKEYHRRKPRVDKYERYCNKLFELQKEYNRVLAEAANYLAESKGIPYSKARVDTACRVAANFRE